MQRSKHSKKPDASGYQADYQADYQAESEKPKSTIEELNELDEAVNSEESGLDDVSVDLEDLNRMAEEDEDFDRGVDENSPQSSSMHNP
jgi:hypothetical protein